MTAWIRRHRRWWMQWLWHWLGLPCPLPNCVAPHGRKAILEKLRAERPKR